MLIRRKGKTVAEDTAGVVGHQKQQEAQDEDRLCNVIRAQTCHDLFREQFGGRLSTFCLSLTVLGKLGVKRGKPWCVLESQAWVMWIARASKFDFVLGVTGVTNTLFVDRGRTESCMVWKPEPHQSTIGKKNFNRRFLSRYETVAILYVLEVARNGCGRVEHEGEEIASTGFCMRDSWTSLASEAPAAVR
ncbi:hypothetical protein MCOR02_001800 [Pyricularia oryzae]|uniref:Uncharacterized protein n=1 Tax=Pyricularia oryzae TaxID=318829 RepID=A0A4P7N0D2_PYROR|nr:hypothetical protein MCOR02_001800 [Pyricularia oryzae]KAI6471614.1 hypothetical protein MCOR17_003126 [Pyricularia oryzae]QBZ55757.1 hypothetical protein PoMZ_00659 [Pyricularia oryzae]